MNKKIVLIALCLSLLPFTYVLPLQTVEDYNTQQLKPIVEHAKLVAKEKNDGVPHFIAIAGCSAVGKSYFTEKLAELLKAEGIKVAILKCDDFLNPDHFDEHHFHPRFEHAVAHSVIQQIKDGAQVVRKPTWNPKELRPPSKIEEQFSVAGVDLILFEGEFTLCNDQGYDFKQYCNFSIFIDAEDKDLIEWNWNRKRSIQEKTKEEFIANTQAALSKFRSFTHAYTTVASYLILKDVDHRYMIRKSEK